MTSGSEIDRLHISLNVDLSDLRASLAQAAREMRTSVNGPLRQQADSLGTIFSDAFLRIGDEIARVAETGKFSFRSMVNTILADLSRLAVRNFIAAPLNALFGNLLGGITFSGGRAGGGPVLPGQAFVVGERGPELFVPSTNGRIVAGAAAAPGRAVTINFNFPAGSDAESFRRSESQMTAMVSRVLARGQRNL